MNMILSILLLISLVSTIQYNATSSKELHNYCLITHCSEQQLSQWTCSMCKSTPRLTDFKYMQNKITSIMVIAGFSTSLDKIILVFRGTVDIKNWLEDLSYYQVKYNRCANCKIHDGFYASYISIAGKVSLALQELTFKYPNKQILIIGSSLGGALATVASIQVQSQFGVTPSLHTFGSPRVGNSDYSMFVKRKTSSSVRVVHYKDIVPHIPLQTQNYHHVPTEIWFDESMKSYKICDDLGEDPSCSNSEYPNYRVEDHTSYWNKLNVTQICGA